VHANESHTKTHRLWRSKRFWMWVGGVCLVLLVSFGVALEYAVRHAEPILRKRVIETLSTRFQTQVELDALHISIFRGIAVTGEGLVVPGIATEGATVVTPLLTVERFEFHTSIFGLLHSPTHVHTVYVQGLAFSLPPKGERPKMPKQQKDSGKISLTVDTIICTDSLLVIETNKPNKLPLEFDIAKITLTNVGPGQPFHFVANLTNPKPVGDIASTGSFGPFSLQDPHDTPVSGHYTFSNADLSTTKGISGILSSTGDYQGTLNNILVDGETDTPDFALDVSDHAVPLHTTYHAIVDGTTGDVTLAPVHAKLLHSTFTATGSVTRIKGVPGHDVELNVVMDDARIEDFLALGFKTIPPLVSGALGLRAKLSIPQGHVPVSQKMKLDGDFSVSGVTFSNPKMQDKVDMLSLRAQAKPKEANPADTAGMNVESRMTGHLKMGDRTIDLSNVQYTLPGAQVLVDGQYSMDGKTFEVHGLVRTKAKLSQMTTGIKSALLKPVDPFFHKNGAGAQIPFKISGTKDEPHFGLDFHDKDKQDHPLLPPPQ
jgi:hypothetical protein